MDDVIRVVDGVLQDLGGLAQLCGQVAEDLEARVAGPVATIGEGSSSDVPGQVKSEADAVTTELKGAVAALSVAIEELGAYREML
ncbi:hypothetical protein Afil01_42720 [Actinorhabdospora filicis]|uniref:Uncharacterized protein n=1 Tax=Actinorhabdospora filicis TaxID=1785913 RepID=A0A9W6SM48_9ACTN|nr:hypothetical protein [Actinorhabdospora filicis]GLZ79465.1 hypothetical protein Afil01_42720 [Actinorhabdospora filicis]